MISTKGMLDLRRPSTVLPIYRDVYMKKLMLLVLAFSLNFSAHAADGFSTLEERMSGKEFKETGLVKLTEAELSELNDWLRRHSVATLENTSARPAAVQTDSDKVAGSTEDLRGLENQPKGDPADKVINGTIVGTFDGWLGKGTLFRLTNGMVWKQVESKTLKAKPVENAEIKIKKGVMGGWRLSMVGYNSSVRVERVK